jgi:hypothetical protein
VRKAGAGQPTLVDEREHGSFPGGGALLPGLGDESDLFVAEVGERPDVLGGMDDDLLPLEGRVEVRDDADFPGVAEPKRLGGRAILAAAAEGAALELLLRRRFELR